MKKGGIILKALALAVVLAGTGEGFAHPVPVLVAAWAQEGPSAGQEPRDEAGPRGRRPGMRRPGPPGRPGEGRPGEGRPGEGRPGEGIPGQPGDLAARRQERQQLMQFRILDRLSRMSPEERERLLEKLPPPRRRMVESNLRRFQEMPPERRAFLAERLRQFEQMTPERQAHLRELLRSVGQLPPERRRILQGEFARMKRMSDEDRLDYISSTAFQERFNERERELLLDLVDTAPAP
jgi:hypothetical protein